jgi:choline dehydrogenase-like flavoprotein
MTSAPFRHGRRLHFAEAGLRILEAPQPRVVTAAVVCGFTVHDDMVRSAQVVSLQGKPFSVAADAFVLATGGIDNARLLLGSRPLLYAMDHAAEHVGRFFMEHLHYVGGYLIPSSVEARDAIAAFVGDPLRPAAWLTPDDEVIRSDDLLRVALTALPVHASSLHPAVPSAGELLRVLPFGPFGFRQRFRQAVVAGRGLHRVMGATLGRLIGEDREVFAVAVMSEQAPDPDSRVVLGARSDRFGLPLPDLHWPTRERDFRDARRTIERLAAGIADAGLGRIETLWDGGRSRPEVVTGGWHHMGTTRMSDDPGSGVVDANGKVHGIRNLYAAGSSVFPTSGFANPTLPLVALAVRLADHLAALSR